MGSARAHDFIIIISYILICMYIFPYIFPYIGYFFGKLLSSIFEKIYLRVPSRDRFFIPGGDFGHLGGVEGWGWGGVTRGSHRIIREIYRGKYTYI